MNRPHLNRCQVCRHAERWRVELLRAGGASLDALAAKFSLDRDAIWRHWQKHVSTEMKAGYLAGPVQLQDLAAKAADQGTSVLDHLHAVRCILMGHLTTATEAGDGKMAAYVAGRLTTTLEVIARISGELGTLARAHVQTINNSVTFVNSPDFANLQQMLVRRLAGHPAALAEVVDGLRELETKSAPVPLQVP